MGRIDDLEHDTVEDGAQPDGDGSVVAVPGLSVTIREHMVTDKAARVAAKKDDRKIARAEMNRRIKKPADAAWCSIENDEIWEGVGLFED